MFTAWHVEIACLQKHDILKRTFLTSEKYHSTTKKFTCSPGTLYGVTCLQKHDILLIKHTFLISEKYHSTTTKKSLAFLEHSMKSKKLHIKGKTHLLNNIISVKSNLALSMVESKICVESLMVWCWMSFIQPNVYFLWKTHIELDKKNKSKHKSLEILFIPYYHTISILT